MSGLQGIAVAFKGMAESFAEMADALKKAIEPFRVMVERQRRYECGMLRTVFGPVPMRHGSHADIDNWQSDMCNVWLHDSCKQDEYPQMDCQCKCHKEK